MQDDDDRRESTEEWHALLPEDWETMKTELEKTIGNAFTDTPVRQPFRFPVRSERRDPIDWRQPCAIEAYFRRHPDQTSVMMVCHCPRCSPHW